LFCLAEAKLLHLHGGLRSDRDIPVFDPVHCYGLPGYLQIIAHLTALGWPRHRPARRRRESSRIPSISQPGGYHTD
jgi:hypothetical protein